MSSIVLTGLATSDPLPGIYLETNFAAGPVAGDSSPLRMVVLANKLAAGSATPATEVYGPDTQTPLQSEADMIALAGAGSEAHRMFLRLARVNKVTSTYWIFVAESAGAAATGTITITGASATAAGNVRVFVGDEFVDVPYAAAATPTTLAAAIVVKVNAKTAWPVTAAAVAGVVTLTAKQKGLRGNQIRFQTVMLAGAGLTLASQADTALTGGTTADDNTAAVDLLKGRADYYIVSAANDATQLGALLAHVNAQAMPTVGNRKRLFAGSTDTLANTTTLAVGLNSARAELVWQYKSDWTAAELAAHCAAVYALEESNTANPRTNFCGYGQDEQTQRIWSVPVPRDKTAAPGRDTDLVVALNNGITPIAPDANGARTYLVDRITTRSLQGAVADFRIRDAHKVTITDFFARDFVAKTALQHSGKRIGDDPAPGEPEPGPMVITPRRWRATALGLIDQYAGNDLLQDVAETKANMIFQREKVPSTRLSCRIPLAPIDNAKQFAAVIDQVR